MILLVSVIEPCHKDVWTQLFDASGSPSMKLFLDSTVRKRTLLVNSYLSHIESDYV